MEQLKAMEYASPDVLKQHIYIYIYIKCTISEFGFHGDSVRNTRRHDKCMQNGRLRKDGRLVRSRG